MSADVSKHTPGPLRVGLECRGSGWVYICADSDPFPQIIGSMRSVPFEESRANAAYLVEAWNNYASVTRERDALAEALRMVVDDCDVRGADGRRLPITPETEARARAAIAAAEGKA